MIDLYTFPTPNGHKVSIALEELALPYEVHIVDITRGAQFEPEFLAVSPNNKIPAVVDREGPGGEKLAVFESGAILVYLAEKTGSLLPTEPAARSRVLQWLFFQMASVGPMFGQANHFLHYAPEKIPYGIERYGKEARRLYGVVDRQLDGRPYIAGDDYSIADIALYPWLCVHERLELDLSDLPHLRDWLARVGERPAVKRGMAVGAGARTSTELDEEAKANLFGNKQFDREDSR